MPDSTNRRQSNHADVVVAGAGFAGLAAAIEAREKGSSVIVLTHKGIYSNNSSIGGGSFALPNTPMQRALGVKDSAEIAAEDILRANGHTVASSLVYAAAKEGEALYDWLHQLGARFVRVYQTPEHSVARVHRYASFRTADLVGKMFEKAKAMGAEIGTGEAAVRLTTDAKGSVKGVVARDSENREVEITAGKAVVLCTGGFARNAALMRQYQPTLAHLPTLSAAGSAGNGIEMALSLGAQLVNMEASIMHPDIMLKKRLHITHGETVKEGAIMVNKEGKRFIDEWISYSRAAFPVMRQTGGVAFLVFDQQTVESVTWMKDYLGLGLVTEAGTAEELAGKLGMDGPALAATIREHNVKAGERRLGDYVKGRPLSGRLYGVPITAGTICTQGGLQISKQAEVLRKDGRAIPHLYAAGETTVGPAGAATKESACSGYLTGTCYLWALAFGRIAGRNAASESLS